MRLKTRVLTIVHDHPSWTSGGTEFAASDLARALGETPGVASRLMAVATDLQRPGAAPLDLVGGDIALRAGRYDRFMMSALDTRRLCGPLEAVLAETRPDVVHLHGVDRLGVEAIPLIRRLAPRARVVMSLHDYQPICALDGLMLTPAGRRCGEASPDACRRCLPEQSAERFALRRAYLLAVFRGVDLFLAPTAFLRARFVDWGLEAERVSVLPNAAPAARRAEASAALRPARDDAPPTRFGFFGAIAERKGVLTLLDAARRLGTRDPDARVILHGDATHAPDAFRARFHASVAAAGDAAAWLGPLRRADIAAAMATVDWVVVPSLWWEGAPLTILEAQRAGRPVICSGIGGMAELVRDGVDGLHVPAGDADALARAMLRAASDRALWGRLAAAAPVPLDPAAQARLALGLYRGLGVEIPA